MEAAPVPDRNGGEPLLGPGTVTWRITREGTLLVGGGRALLLQVAHPLVMAGVEQHSNYASDPWGRLIGTLETTFQIVFGDRETSAAASNRLRRRHDPVKGTSPDGVPYDAQDPALMLWVWATLVDSALVVYERCVRRLTDDERERFYQEQKLFAYACGVPEGSCPESFEDFTAYYEDMLAGELRVTPGALAVADSIMRTPVPLPLRPLLRGNALITIGLLPTRLRTEYGFAWGPGRERGLRAALAALRLGNRATPRVLRERPAVWLANGSFRRGVGGLLIDRLRMAAQS